MKPTPIPPAPPEAWPKPATADRGQLELVLRRKPVLWVGEGLSVDAGYPSAAGLIEAMNREAGGTLDTSQDFLRVADQFVDALTGGALDNLLQQAFSPPRPPTPAHHAIAQLAKAGRIHAILTTNADTLIEDALRAARVPYVEQALEDNAATTGGDALRLMKIHGSLTSWKRAVTSGRSYATWEERQTFLRQQLGVLLGQRPVLLIGCSLREPALLDWLAALPEDATLEVWRALVTQSTWDAAMSYRWEGGHASGALTRGKVRPLRVADDAEVTKLLGEAAAEVTIASASVDIEVAVGEALSASLVGCAFWTPADPHADPNLVAALAELRERDAHALPVNAAGRYVGEAAAKAAALQDLAVRVGETLTSALLSAEARTRVAAVVRTRAAGTTPLLTLRVRGGTTEEERQRADHFLALPWELLRVEDEFPVERGKLDLAREVVVEGVAGLEAPQRELSVVATVAAPVDAVSLDYEGECYRLWRAMGAEERRLLITDLGTFDALVTAVQAHHPPVVHFTGHGEPGRILFENEEAQSDPVEVHRLVDRLRGHLPRLVFLASCYGASTERSAHAAGDHRMVDPAALTEDPTWSSAAELHREGVPQVVAWFGPVGDAQSTRAEAVFYAALVRGRTARAAVREARQRCRDPLPGTGTVYPLGWAQLALYHRGADLPTVLPATAAGVDIGGADRERIKERLDSSHGPVGVERLVHGFVGRRSARAEAIRRWQAGQRVLVIHGPGGFGKTALCAEVAPILASRLGVAKPVRVVALDGRFAGEREDAVAALWEQVAAFAEGDVWNAELARLQKDGITGEALAGAVLALARREGGLLVYLDDAESLQAPVGEGSELGTWRDAGVKAFWARVAAAAGKEKGFGILASTRYVPEGVPDRVCLPLPVMREMDLVRLLRWWPTLGGLSAEDMDWLVGRLEGHPRSVQWLEELAATKVEALVPPGGRFDGDLRREVVEKVLPEVEAKVSADMLLPRVIEAVGEEAKAHLERCTVLVVPAPWGAVLALEDVEGTGKRLARAGLLAVFDSVPEERWWAPPPVVVRASSLPEERQEKEASCRIGRWFLGCWEQRFAYGAYCTYYLCKGGAVEDAQEPAEAVINSLHDAGRFRESLWWTKLVLDAGASTQQRGLCLLHQAECELTMGLATPNTELSLAESLALVDDEARHLVLARTAVLHHYLGHVHKAISTFRQAEKAWPIRPIDGSRITFVCEFAGALMAASEFDEARKIVEATKCDYAEGQNEPAAMGPLLEVLGMIMLEQGDKHHARNTLREALRTTRSALSRDESLRIVDILQNVARAELECCDYDVAQGTIEEALGFWKQTPDLQESPGAAKAHYILGRVLARQGKFGAARASYTEALNRQLKIFRNEIHQDVAESLHGLAHLSMSTGDLAAARKGFERVLRIEQALYTNPHHHSIAITKKVLGSILFRMGNVRGGRKLLREAYESLSISLGVDHSETKDLAVFLRIK